MMFKVEPIGYFQSSSKALYDVPYQPSLYVKNEGIIQLNSGLQFEQALEGVKDFDLIWVLFRFHRHVHWKPKVLPPRGGKKRGVFSTRSPHRPNFIGLSCVQLQSIQGLKLFIVNHDLIDGTPILDLKPYLNYADSFVSQRQGWLENIAPNPTVTIQWLPLARKQIDYLLNLECHLQQVIEHRLVQSPLPYANNRVRHIQEEWYELAYRTWRVYYQWKNGVIDISHLKSGYDSATLRGEKSSKWADLSIHQAFVCRFNSKESVSS